MSDDDLDSELLGLIDEPSKRASSSGSGQKQRSGSSSKRRKACVLILPYAVVIRQQEITLLHSGYRRETGSTDLAFMSSSFRGLITEPTPTTRLRTTANPKSRARRTTTASSDMPRPAQEPQAPKATRSKASSRTRRIRLGACALGPRRDYCRLRPLTRSRSEYPLAGSWPSLKSNGRSFLPSA